MVPETAKDKRATGSVSIMPGLRQGSRLGEPKSVSSAFNMAPGTSTKRPLDWLLKWMESERKGRR